MKIAALLFDMDGTIVDNTAFHTEAWGAWLAQRGIVLGPDGFATHIAGRTNSEILRHFLGEGLTPAEVARFAEEKEAAYRQHYAPYVQPAPGLEALLAAAEAAAIPCALVTSAPPINAAFILERLGWQQRFATLVTGDDVQRSKPDPEGFLLAAARLAADPAACVVFEDALFGIEAAQRAGMRAVALTTTTGAAAFADFPHLIAIQPDFQGLLAQLQLH